MRVGNLLSCIFNDQQRTIMVPLDLAAPSPHHVNFLHTGFCPFPQGTLGHTMTQVKRRP